MKTRGAMRFILVLLAAAVAVGCSNGVTGPGGSPSDNTGGGGGLVPPTLNPPPDQGEVSVTSNLAIEFASNIDPSSITDSDFTVRRSPTYLGSMRSTGSGLTVDLIVGTLEIVGNKIIFTPDQPLAHATSYVVEITAVIKDVDGNILADGLSWTFTTEPAPDVIYVAVTGTDNGTCGLGPQTPCGTIDFALDRASDEGRDTLAISEGTYAEQVELHSGINLYGFTSEWAPTADPSLVVIQAPAVSSGEMAVAVYAQNLNDATKLRALTIEAPDAAGGSGTATSSYGMYVNETDNLTLEQLIIVGGQAVDGTDGTDGVDADQTAAPAGGDGWDSRFHGEFAVTGIAAGDGGGEGDRQGGDGGPGWAPDFGHLGSTYWYWPKPGFRGSDAAVFEESGFGSGGPAPAVAEMGLDGSDGRTIHGTGGSSAAVPGEVIGDVWTVDVDDARGATGELGEDGTGGGGGSGTGGYEQAVYDGTSNYVAGGYTGAGAGGGGAGGLAAPQAGTGGTSGGSVFGVFAVNSTLDITDLVLKGARAGTGGDGGAGGKGQPGGAGGQGGHMDMPEFPDVNLWGGRGGDGGDGGTSGGGGGGAGGNVYAIFSVDSTVSRSQISITDSQAGSGGEGGSGPAPGAADDGSDGPDGEKKNFEQW